MTESSKENEPESVSEPITFVQFECCQRAFSWSRINHKTNHL